MADLDDFFAKRDKKKPKGKKFATADDASKILENKAKERKKLETLRTTYVPPLNEQGEAPAALSEYRQQQADDDDEWKEVEEVKPDYTGLKIQELILDDDDDEFGPKDPEVREEGDEDKNGPWNKKERKEKGKEKEKDEPKTAQTPVEPAVEEKIEQPEVTEATEIPVSADETPEEPAKKTGGYVPPGRRQELAKVVEPSPDGAGAGAGAAPPPASAAVGEKKAYVPPGRRGQSDSATAAGAKKKPTAPLDLNDESFPTLGS
ncbi:unnamed protein product [Allacma fusca]|uniref:Uncharacterized protein n=2 Tax=Allacma fusca TaxID=39272 RepID=A0A8J2MAS3_9HEXA|nr:unnamed protein product [Allacma fusca]